MTQHDAGASLRERAAIDAGHTGDKAPGLDPAMAPLGTDDEAAGTRPQESITPAPNPSATKNSPSPTIAPTGQESENRAMMIGIAAGVILLVAAIAFMLL